MHPSELFDRSDELKEIFENENQTPLMMAKITLELSQNETLMI